MAAERIALYRRVPYPGRSIPVALTPYPVENFIPEEEEVAWGFLCLHMNRDGPLYGTSTEHLRSWL